MKKIFLIVLLVLLMHISKEGYIPEQYLNMVKCFFSSKKRIDDSISIIEMLFNGKNFDLIKMLTIVNDILKECLQINLDNIIKDVI